jgi:hypothetical protein
MIYSKPDLVPYHLKEVSVNWQTGEYAWALVATISFVAGVVFMVWEFSIGWTPIRIWREYRGEIKRARQEARPRHTSYEWGPRLGMSLVLWIWTGVAVFNLFRWSLALPPWQ